MSSSSSLRLRLAELLLADGATGRGDALAGEKVTPVKQKGPSSDSTSGAADRNDRSDRSVQVRALQRGRFRIGGSYKSRRIDMLHRLSDKDRAMLDEAGFPRAAPVVIEGVGLLIDDLARFMAHDRFMVLAFMDFPENPTTSGRVRKR